MTSGDTRPAQLFLENVAAGGSFTYTVPDGEVAIVRSISGSFGAETADDYMVLNVTNGVNNISVFTFATTTTGNNSYTVPLYLVLDAGHQMILSCTDGTTFASCVASADVTTIY